MNENRKKEVNLYMDMEMYEELKKLALENSLTCSAQARMIINQYIKEHKKDEV